MERTKQGEFAWTDLTAKDLDGQTSFYESLFGWQHRDLPFGEGMVYREFSIDGKTVCGAAPMPAEMAAGGAPSAWNIYIAVDDVDASLAKAVELGATIAMPAMDVMGRGRYAAIMDPTGAAVFLWHATLPDQTMNYMDPGFLAWCDLTTREPEEAREFYRALVGWDFTELEGGGAPYWQATVGGEGEGGVMPMPEMIPPEVPSFWMDYFDTVDVAASVARARELGATVMTEPTEVPGMLSFAVLTDPAGATFALLQPRM